MIRQDLRGKKKLNKYSFERVLSAIVRVPKAEVEAAEHRYEAAKKKKQAKRSGKK